LDSNSFNYFYLDFKKLLRQLKATALVWQSVWLIKADSLAHACPEDPLFFAIAHWLTFTIWPLLGNDFGLTTLALPHHESFRD